MQLSNIYEKGLFARGVICKDCLLKLANDDTSGASESWNEAQFNKTVATYDVILSEHHVGNFTHGCFHDGEECEHDCECRQHTISTQPCNCCKDKLDGYREDVLFIRRSLYRKDK